MSHNLPLVVQVLVRVIPTVTTVTAQVILVSVVIITAEVIALGCSSGT